VNKLLVVERETHVRGTGRDGREEHQIARADLVQINVLPDLILLCCRTWRSDLMSGEHVLNEAAAIKTRARLVAAPAIRHALETECCFNHGGRHGGWPRYQVGSQ